MFRREVIRKKLVPFAEQHPQISFETSIRRNQHPFLEAKYLNGKEKVINVQNLTPSAIVSHMHFLRTQDGRKAPKITNPVLRSTTPSVQGEWTETFSLKDTKMGITHYFK